MYQLIYTSIHNNLKPTEIVSDIVEKSKANNLRDNITGILVFSSGYFLQCLEGDKSAINTTFINITKDSRHFNLNLISYEQVFGRTFPYWTMAFIAQKDIDKGAYFRHGITEFNPYKMDSKAVLPFLRGLGLVYTDKMAHPLEFDPYKGYV
ncbi:MAG: BLUF domain-containing protein [Oligoflexales bacterium]